MFRDTKDGNVKSKELLPQEQTNHFNCLHYDDTVVVVEVVYNMLYVGNYDIYIVLQTI